MSAERIAWNLGLPLLKVRFDALLSSYFGESASNLRSVFDYCMSEPVVLLLDECDFIAKSRIASQDVGEVPRIVNMLLILLDEYSAPGLVVATTNLKIQLDEALFRRFDDVIEIPMPEVEEREKLLRMTLSAISIEKDVCFYSKCDVAVVLTNSTFTKGAIELAEATGVLLWDGNKLDELIHRGCSATMLYQAKAQGKSGSK